MTVIEQGPYSGGCQCGAIRYRVAALGRPSFCHCRMCQKAFGNYFAALVGTKKTGLHWTKGEPSFFRSSEIVQRGFCKDCGTPLTFAYDTSEAAATKRAREEAAADRLFGDRRGGGPAHGLAAGRTEGLARLHGLGALAAGDRRQQGWHALGRDHLLSVVPRWTGDGLRGHRRRRGR